MVIVIIATIL